MMNPGLTSAKLLVPENVVCIIHNPETGRRRTIRGTNIVTNDGDDYYAQKAAGETADNTYDSLRLGTDNTTPTKTDTDVTTFLTDADTAVATGYPKTNDDDVDNSGAATDVISWKFEFTTTDFNGSGIVEGAITDDQATPTTALCHFLFAASFDKSASERLTVFINHRMNGV